MSTKISSLEGPILVLGAGGFIGSNLFGMLRSVRDDVNETRNVKLDGHARAFIELYKPRTIFDCIAYGGYPAQTDVGRIYQTNVALKAELLELASEYHCTYIHAGSSSEYGTLLDAPREDGVRAADVVFDFILPPNPVKSGLLA